MINSRDSAALSAIWAVTLGDLANRWFQPLTHVSGCSRCGAIARVVAGGNGCLRVIRSLRVIHREFAQIRHGQAVRSLRGKAEVGYAGERKGRVDRSDRIGHVGVDGFKVDRLVPRLRTPVWGQ